MKVVTGAGKTNFALMAMSDYFASEPEGVAVVIVPTLALLDQWFLDVAEEWGESNIASFSGESKSPNLGKINLIVLDTARRLAPAIANKARTFLVVDECHRTGSPKNALALRGNHAASLGLSATPERQYDDGLVRYVAPALGEVVFEYTLEEARRDGIVCPFNLDNILVPMLIPEERKYVKLTARIKQLATRRDCDGDVSDETLRRLLLQRASVAANARLRVPVAVRTVLDTKRQRVLVFHEKIAAAEEIFEALKRAGESVTIYHSKVPRVLRQDNLRLFRKRAYRCLITCRALDEGLNVPDVSVGVIAASSASIRQRIQRVGRLLRPFEDKVATVITLYTSEAEHQRLRKEEIELEDVASIRWIKARVKS